MPHFEETCTEKFVCFCLGSVELQMCEKWHFLYSCKIHTCLLHPGFLGLHDTLPCVLIYQTVAVAEFGIKGLLQYLQV